MTTLPLTLILLTAAICAAIGDYQLVSGLLLLLAVAAEAFADRLS